jgi:hypothetical protein
MNTTTKAQQKSKIKAVFGSVFSFPISPRRQFRRLVFVMFTMLILVIFAHLYLFNRISSHNIFTSTVIPVSTASVINEKKLTDVLTRYEAKNKKRIELQMNPVVVGDPSR